MHGIDRSLLNLPLQTHLTSKATYLVLRTGTGSGIPHRANAPSRLDNVRQSAREAVGKPKTQTGINLLGVLLDLVNRTPKNNWSQP